MDDTELRDTRSLNWHLSHILAGGSRCAPVQADAMTTIPGPKPRFRVLDDIIVRPRRDYATVGAATAGFFPVAVIWLVNTMSPVGGEPTWPILTMGFSFGAVGVWMVLVRMRVWARFSDTGIEGHRLFGRVDRVRWERIISVRHSLASGSLVFHGRDGERVYVPQSRDLLYVQRILEHRLRRDIYDEALTLAFAIMKTAW